MARIARDTGFGLLAVGLLLLSVVAALAQQPVKIYGLTIPDFVGGLSRGQLNDYEARSPGLGYSILFPSRSGWIVDVYIYDLQLKFIPDDIESSVVREQLTRARGAVFELGRRGSYANVQEGSEFTIGRSGRTRFVCTTFSYLRGEKRDLDVVSYLCLTSWNNKFVKIRMTAPKGAMSRADAVNFVEAWIALLSPAS
jgi:hypothetical protein